MKKYFVFVLLLVSFVLPVGVSAADLKMTFDENVGISNNRGDYIILPSYDNSGKIDGNLIYFKSMPMRVEDFSSNKLIVELAKYNLDNELLYRKQADDLYDNTKISVRLITENDNSGYIVKGKSDVLISVYDSSSATTIFTKQYGGNGCEKKFNEFQSYDNNGIHDGYLVLIMSDSTDLGIDPGYIMLKYDLKGNLVWQKNINDYLSNSYVSNDKINIFYVRNNNSIIRDDYLNDKDLWNNKTDLNRIYKISLSYTKDGVVDGIVAVGNILNSTNNYVGIIVKYDLDGNEVFRYKYDKPSYFFNVASSRYIDGTYDGYIVTGISDEGTFILKYDYDGNIVYKNIYSDKYYSFEQIAINYDNTGKQNGYILLSSYVNRNTDVSFNINAKKVATRKLSNVKKAAESGYNRRLLTIVKYTYPVYDIVKDKSDDGEIIVSDNACPGDIVKVSVTPKEGYTLKRIVVMDEDGKEIEVNEDGTFVMPEGKVTVVALYNRISNPDTTSACYIVLGIILIISVGTLIVSKKKEA